MSLKMRDGFTLAEVLITLAIIGVVAALTTPAIIRNSQNAKIGPTLAKICTTMETAIQAACNEQEKLYFKDVVNPDNPADLSLPNRMDLLSQKYMKAKSSASATLPPVVTRNIPAQTFTPTGGVVFGSDPVYLFSDKSAVIVPSGCTLGDGSTEKCEIFAIIAGFQGRTRLVLGQDIFPLMVTKEGDVLPPGLADDMDVSGYCTDEALDAGTDDGYYCGDRAANNGWKANWK